MLTLTIHEEEKKIHGTMTALTKNDPSSSWGIAQQLWGQHVTARGSRNRSPLPVSASWGLEKTYAVVGEFWEKREKPLMTRGGLQHSNPCKRLCRNWRNLPRTHTMSERIYWMSKVLVEGFNSCLGWNTMWKLSLLYNSKWLVSPWKVMLRDTVFPQPRS